MTPPVFNKFQSGLIDQCRAKSASIVLPESADPRVLQAASWLVENNCTGKIALIGSQKNLKDVCKSHKVSLDFDRSDILLVSEEMKDIQEKSAAIFKSYLENRGKPVKDSDLINWGNQPENQASALLKLGIVDGALAGCVFTTAQVIRAALQGIGLRQNNKTISGSFAMVKETEKEDFHFMYGDCGVVIDPTIDQLVDIARETVKTFQQLFPNKEAKVAFLSFSTKGSARHPMATKMSEAASKFKEMEPAILSDGELQFDAAFVPEVGQRKCPDSPVAGSANCFIFPNLDAGNLVYKVSQRLGGFDAYGPILQGTEKPYSDLSRGATAKDIFVSSLITMLRS